MSIQKQKNRKAISDYRRKRRRTDPTYREREIAYNSTYTRAWERRTRASLWQTILSHYGARCACCGETTFGFLTLDHVNGGGTQHRKRRRSSSINIYRDVIESGFPVTYRVLCMNCNWATRLGNACPHQVAAVPAI